MLKECIRRAAELRSRSEEISSALSAAKSVKEKAKIFDSWCLQASRFLDEAAIANQLLTSFRRWGTFS